MVADGLFELHGDEPRLIGTRCAACGTVYFPQAPSCRNPDCREKTVERAVLPTRGVLVSYTVQRYQPPALFRIDDWQPYAIGLVDLGDGLEVMGMLSGFALDGIAIGTRVRLVAESLYAEAERGPVLTYKFAREIDA
ncbi:MULTISPECIES: Zn-ribbon domain-containing OB-fold protein [Sphingomonas]|uniref:Zn-ribbon domain-containing OB-fold protein n=1 Tax=Sphingomonas TaxID=13687 RepID=UPI002FE2A4C0